ncbi:MAG TPA: DUF305 domain-containing protein [Ktedonobacteraceae bacterium]
MTSSRRARVSHARRQRQEEDRLQTGDPCAETSHTTTALVHRGMLDLFRRLLPGLGMAVFALALVSAAASPSTGPGEASFLARSNAAMTRMIAGMKIKPSHNVDRDFVAMMVPHHQGAIDMAEAELSYGHNEPLRRLAQEIIVTQQEEIAEMRLALVSTAASPYTGPEEASFLAKSDAAMVRMMAAMQIKPSHNVDRDFVAMMVPHHQGAIDMAEAELSYGHNEPLRGLAQEIIATQEQQIAAMRRALGEPLPASLPSFHQPSSSSRHLLSTQWTPLRED